MKAAPIIAALLIGTYLMISSRKAWAIPQKGMQYFPFFSQAEYQYGLPSRLLARVAEQESDFNPEAVNAKSGAQGLMQIVPRWHPDAEPFNPQNAIFYAAQYLRENYNRFGSWSKALAAYNWGPGNMSKTIEKHGDNWLAFVPTETRNYVNGVTGDLGIV